jgi:cysteine desulfurase
MQSKPKSNKTIAGKTKQIKTIYLDNAATTMVDPEVVKEMDKYNSKFYGNASSMHHKGEEAHKALEKARAAIAKSINAEPEDIIFTSGGTESNNLAIKGVAFAMKEKSNSQEKRNHIIITKIEHDCVLNAAKWLEKQGFVVTYLDVDKEGFVNVQDLERAIRPETILVSIIHGNNEIGTIQDIARLAEICRKNNVLFHTDACQSYLKTEIDVVAQNLDLVTLNAHKLHGPKGVGALYVRKGIRLVPLNHGGGHEKGLRNGTENIPGIVGFAKAVEVAQKNKAKIKQIAKLKDYFIKKLLEIPDTKLNGPLPEAGIDKRLYNNVNISFRHIEGESIVAMLDLKGICASTGSACSSRTLDPSHVIMALSEDAERAHGSIRFSISKHTTKNEIDFTVKETKKIVEYLRQMSPLKN